ncbi:MAG: preprotein translocase subunit SecE [Candidatus Omnitrophica bacterium]|nr:preprotein translocase subunit SecE [Candidatus Omnitrophota bacterium]
MDFIANNLKTVIWATVSALVLFLVAKNFARIKNFLLEVKAELGKVAWSTPQEVYASTIIVITVTFIAAVFIGAVDLTLTRILTMLFKQ